MNFFEKLRGIIVIDTTELFFAINSIRKNKKKKPAKSIIYQHLQKDEKHKELEFETFNQVIETYLSLEQFLQKHRNL